MDIRSRIGSLLLLTTSQTLWSSSRNQTALIKPCFSRKNRPQQSGDNDDDDDNSSGGKFSTDWDKAWTRFKKQGKKTIFSEFSPNKYVSRNPRPSNYPLSEEVDPIKRAERSNLMLWTSPSFTLGLAIVIVTFLMVYTILAPIK
ncbi:hypothetical protein LOK49_LG05G00601 [Camellia lanceoleosa]|uniref:Uncharacterized protein n=1 Tax=Camellia lanceoleosa TaxID=1840588 RepID=A0ACC0HP76_9ERIC|nr:hypothetical protein LOK49_LG05G00601 [Camellia lanceoleosa]